MPDEKENNKTGGWLVKELAEAAGLNPSRIRQLLLDGTLDGEKRGPAWLIPDHIARQFLEERKP